MIGAPPSINAIPAEDAAGLSHGWPSSSRPVARDGAALRDLRSTQERTSTFADGALAWPQLDPTKVAELENA